MKSVDYMRRRHSDCGDEQCGFLIDNDVDELVEETFCVVVICFSRCATDGWEGEIDAEWEVRGGEEGFEFLNHGAQLCGGVAQSADDT